MTSQNGPHTHPQLQEESTEDGVISLQAWKFFTFHFFLALVTLSLGLGYSLIDVSRTQEAVLDRELASAARALATTHDLDSGMHKFQLERQMESVVVEVVEPGTPNRTGKIVRRTSGVPFAESERIPIGTAAGAGRGLATVELLSLLPSQPLARAARVLLPQTSPSDPLRELMVYSQAPHKNLTQAILALPGLPLRAAFVVAGALLFALLNWLGFHALVEVRTDE